MNGRDARTGLRRRLVIAAALAPLAASLRAAPGGSYRLGCFLGGKPEELENKAQFIKALADRNLVEGRNLAIEWRFTHEDAARSTSLAQELVRLSPNAIVSMGTPCTRALQQATRTIPIVAVVSDPVGGGFAKSLARPGGNITGFSLATSEVARKQLELLRTLMPRLKRLLVLVPVTYSPSFGFVDALMAEAKAGGVAAQLRSVGSVGEIEAQLAPLGGSRTSAAFFYLILQADPVKVAEAAVRHRVATMHTWNRHVEAGGLISYNLAHRDLMTRLAAVIDEIFTGASPAAIPFELPSASFLAVNRRTAAALGLEMPEEILLRADQVIE